MQFGVNRIFFTFCFEIGNRRQWHVDMGVDQFLSTRNAGQVQCRIDNGIDSSDVGNQSGRVETLAHHGDCLFHVIGVTTARAYDMRVGIVYVIEVELCFEVRFGRACKEVEASVECEDRIGLFNYRSYRSEYKYVVVTFPVGQGLESFHRILHFASIDIFQLDSVFRSLFG